MYCIRCGKEISAESTYCPECGLKVPVNGPFYSQPERPYEWQYTGQNASKKAKQQPSCYWILIATRAIAILSLVVHILFGFMCIDAIKSDIADHVRIAVDDFEVVSAYIITVFEMTSLSSALIAKPDGYVVRFLFGAGAGFAALVVSGRFGYATFCVATAIAVVALAIANIIIDRRHTS